MFGIKAVLLLSLVINVLVNGYQDDGSLDEELEVLLKRLQERLEDEERGYELEDLFERQQMSEIVTEPVTETFNDMKFRKAYKWATFKMDNNKRIVVDMKSDPPGSIGEDEARFNELKLTLTPEPRYILFDFRFEMDDGRDIRKLAFIFWCDESYSPRDKMVYMSNKDIIKQQFTGISLEFQANRKTDFDYKAFRAIVATKA